MDLSAKIEGALQADSDDRGLRGRGPDRMKRWILVSGGKGGVGKSLVARLLAETKRETEPRTWLVDGRAIDERVV